MQIYDYHGETGEFLGERTARESPLEPGTPLIPANATTTAPPAAQAGQARVWNGSAWAQVEDNRGTRYWTAADGLADMDALGPLPGGATVVPGADPILYRQADGTYALTRDPATLSLRSADFYVELYSSGLVDFSGMNPGETVRQWLVRTILASALPEPSRTVGAIRAETASVFLRSDPEVPGMMEAVGAILPRADQAPGGLTGAEIDALFEGAQ